MKGKAREVSVERLNPQWSSFSRCLQSISASTEHFKKIYIFFFWAGCFASLVFNACARSFLCLCMHWLLCYVANLWKCFVNSTHSYSYLISVAAVALRVRSLAQLDVWGHDAGPRRSSRGWTRSEEWKWGVREQEGGEETFTASFSHHQHNISCCVYEKCVYDASGSGFYSREMVHLWVLRCMLHVFRCIASCDWASDSADGSIISTDVRVRIKRDLSFFAHTYRDRAASSCKP